MLNESPGRGPAQRFKEEQTFRGPWYKAALFPSPVRALLAMLALGVILISSRESWLSLAVSFWLWLFFFGLLVLGQHRGFLRPGSRFYVWFTVSFALVPLLGGLVLFAFFPPLGNPVVAAWALWLAWSFMPLVWLLLMLKVARGRMTTECTDQAVVLTGVESEPILVRYEEIILPYVVHCPPLWAPFLKPAFRAPYRYVSMGGNEWVRIDLKWGSVLVGSRRARELAEAIEQAITPLPGGYATASHPSLLK